MVNASENLATKNQVDNALDLVEKFRGKIKETFIFMLL